jgi:hypothetical protein
MFTIRAIGVAVLSLGCALLVSANEPPPKKPNPPKQNPQPQQQQQMQQQQHKLTPQQQQQQQVAMLAQQQQVAQLRGLQQLQMLGLRSMWANYLLSRMQMPFVPGFAPGYAYLPNYLPNMYRNPGMGGYPVMQPTAPGTAPTTPAGYSRELVLEMSDTTTYSQLRPGSVTQYQPAKSDALKVGQYINVLAKNDATAAKPGTWSFPALITAIDDGDPKKLTVMAKLDSTQADFTPDNKIVTGVSIRAQAGAAAPKAAN